MKITFEEAISIIGTFFILSLPITALLGIWGFIGGELAIKLLATEIIFLIVCMFLTVN